MALVFFLLGSALSECPMNVHDSVFANIYSSGDGGSICLESSACSLQITRTFFANSSSAGYGGAISMLGSDLSCNHSCFVLCSSKQRGFSIYTSSMQSIVLDLAAISQCFSTNSTNGACNMVFVTNYTYLSRTNFTMNHAAYHTSTAWTAGSISQQWSHSSIINNTDADGATLNVRGAAIPNTFSYINFFNNTPTGGNGFLFFSENATGVVFSHCNFFNNGNSVYVYLYLVTAYPSFVDCIFDVLQSTITYCSVSACSFQQSSVPTITNSFLAFESCGAIKSTAKFSSDGGSMRLPMVMTISLLAFCIT